MTGAAMLVRADVFGDAGFLPEHYFLYSEETDFNISARAAGWKTMIDTRARAHHFKRSSGFLPKPYYIYYFVRNRLLFGMRHTDVSADRIEEDLEGFLAAWRDRVHRRSPGALSAFDRLVATAISDGRNGVTGRSEAVGAVRFDKAT